MHYIIFASYEPHELGRQVLKLADGNTNIHTMPCVVVREATRDEWITDHPDCNADVELRGATHFYALSVD